MKSLQTDGQTDGRTDDGRQTIRRLTCAFSSGELKKREEYLVHFLSIVSLKNFPPTIAFEVIQNVGLCIIGQGGIW